MIISLPYSISVQLRPTSSSPPSPITRNFFCESVEVGAGFHVVAVDASGDVEGVRKLGLGRTRGRCERNVVINGGRRDPTACSRD